MKSQRTKHIDKIIKERYKITQEQLYDILTAPFDFQVSIMKDVTDMQNHVYPSVRIPNFGLFYIPIWIRERYKEKYRDGVISAEQQ